MRHGKRFNHLGRTASHRKAMLSNMASSLLVHKRINTTLAKAKELRKYVEPLITKAKNDSTHSRRVVFSYLQDKESVNALFNEVVDRVANRPGGYTRIIKLGTRLGDNAEMAMIELVDFNDLLIQEAEPKKAKTRRSRRGSKAKQAPKAEAKTEKEEEKAEEVKTVEEEAKTEDVIEDTTEEVEEKKVEAKVDEVKEEVKEEEPKEDKKAKETKAKEADDKSADVKEDKSSEEVKATTEEPPAAKAKEEKKSKKESKDSGEEKNKN